MNDKDLDDKWWRELRAGRDTHDLEARVERAEQRVVELVAERDALRAAVEPVTTYVRTHWTQGQTAIDNGLLDGLARVFLDGVTP